ncbi:baseplate J/gp47 family protein [Nitrosovibrio sp. Nv4]|uniref:baseplate J/gp47 family protein n=1 Tax=Nitrosovibrio sp. Nv4 TaxID=1945880 RepID=UPI000BC65AB3|nr:baseplate J/gp47 family protein [Nitrosovibrio sp. Nv4]SOD42339.1 Uncharacterized phage protein gp47/JayE [Nitrosovibrio sp. Nv4]
MPFSRPTLADLIERSISDIEARLPGVDARLRRSNLNVLSRVHAGAIHGLYGYLDWLSKQVIYDTAEAEILDRWATIWLAQPRKAAVSAIGDITFTGTDGAVIPTGTLLQRADGAAFTTNAAATISAGTATAAVTASLAGTAGNTDAAATLNMVVPIAGVNAAATVAVGGLSQGSDTEADANLRARLIARIRQPPHGGADYDYIAWALEVAGVTRAWVYPKELGLGTVTVRFVRDDDASIIPDAAEVTAVQDYIDARRPVTAVVTVVAPVAAALNFTISAVTSVRDAIAAALTDMLLREAEPGGTILLSRIHQAISVAAGDNDYTLNVPSADVTHTAGKLATMGTITWA